MGHARAAEVEQAALKLDFLRLSSQHLPDCRCFLLALPECCQGTRVKFIPVPVARGDTTPSVLLQQHSTKMPGRALLPRACPSSSDNLCALCKLPRLFIPSIISQSILAKTPNSQTQCNFFFFLLLSLEVNKIHYFPSTNVSLQH